MLKLFLILSLASVAFASDCYSPCPANEKQCDNGNCVKTCNVITVSPKCISYPGCICEFGYLRNSNGVCVPKDKCDSPCDGDLGKVYDPCGASCQRTCHNIKDPEWQCDRVCEEGACRCNEGLVEHRGECIEPRFCEKECPVNEAYSSCRANNCQDTCANPNLRLECRDLTCENGCVCTAGHVRDHNDVCIPLGQCGVTCDNVQNAYLEKCATSCDNRACSEIEDEKLVFCGATGQCSNRVECVCKKGYYRENGQCIPKKHCPTCDGENEEWVRRSRDFECSNIDENILKEKGRDGCFCKLGYARDCDGKCVPLKECNQKSCGGDVNAYFELCDIFCERTCTYKQGKPCFRGTCSKNGQCVCKDGFVKNDQGKCILPEHCDYCHRSFIPAGVPGCVVPRPVPTDCGVNEQYENFPVGKCTPADQTCDMYFKGILRDCKFGEFGEPGCRCRPAYVRNSNGVCVLPQDCCGKNSIFVTGHNVVGGTCSNPEVKVRHDLWQPFGCQCEKGYLKISDTDPTCVPACECSQYS